MSQTNSKYSFALDFLQQDIASLLERQNYFRMVEMTPIMMMNIFNENHDSTPWLLAGGLFQSSWLVFDENEENDSPLTCRARTSSIVFSISPDISQCSSSREYAESIDNDDDNLMMTMVMVMMVTRRRGMVSHVGTERSGRLAPQIGHPETLQNDTQSQST